MLCCAAIASHGYEFHMIRPQRQQAIKIHKVLWQRVPGTRQNVNMHIPRDSVERRTNANPPASRPQTFKSVSLEKPPRVALIIASR